MKCLKVFTLAMVLFGSFMAYSMKVTPFQQSMANTAAARLGQIAFRFKAGNMPLKDYQDAQRMIQQLKNFGREEQAAEFTDKIDALASDAVKEAAQKQEQIKKSQQQQQGQQQQGQSQSGQQQGQGQQQGGQGQDIQQWAKTSVHDILQNVLGLLKDARSKDNDAKMLIDSLPVTTPISESAKANSQHTLLKQSVASIDNYVSEIEDILFDLEQNKISANQIQKAVDDSATKAKEILVLVDKIEEAYTTIKAIHQQGGQQQQQGQQDQQQQGQQQGQQGQQQQGQQQGQGQQQQGQVGQMQELVQNVYLLNTYNGEIMCKVTNNAGKVSEKTIPKNDDKLLGTEVPKGLAISTTGLMSAGYTDMDMNDLIDEVISTKDGHPGSDLVIKIAGTKTGWTIEPLWRDFLVSNESGMTLEFSVVYVDGTKKNIGELGDKEDFASNGLNKNMTTLIAKEKGGTKTNNIDLAPLFVDMEQKKKTHVDRQPFVVVNSQLQAKVMWAEL